MTSSLVRRAWEQAGLLPLWQARSERHAFSPTTFAPILERADLLALAALAEEVTRKECGEEVRIHVASAPLPSASVVLFRDRDPDEGTSVFRKLATLRVLGPFALPIVFDWGALGWNLAQLSLAFGASELCGPLLSTPPPETTPKPHDGGRHGVDAARVAALVERSGRRPVFVGCEAKDADRHMKTALPMEKP